MELQKGQKVKLRDLTNSLQIELKTTIQMRAGSVDISCFGVDQQGKLSDDRYFVFYNQTETPEKAITMSQQGTTSSFQIDLAQLPVSIEKLVLTVAADENETMKDIVQGELFLSAGTQILAHFAIQGNDYIQERAIILGELYVKDGVWRWSVVASGFNGGLSALLAHFGGEEAAPVPIQAPVSKQAQINSPASKSEAVLPATASKPVAPSGLISLKKSGDKHKISLDKNSKEIHVNLNWDSNSGTKKGLFGSVVQQAIDLDLACMYRLKNGQQGVIQALGHAFGSATDLPYIFLDQDDRTGASQNGENMWFKKPEMIDFAVVFAYIYSGVPNWDKTGARIVLKQQGSPDISIQIDRCHNPNRFCVIASLRGSGNQLEITREERFFAGHKEVDKHYGFGFRWTAGHK